MRQRVTVSVPKELLRSADRVAKRLGVRSRSALVVNALECLIAADRAREIDAELDAYYGSQTPSERAEERAMVKAFQRSRRRLDLDR